MHSYPSNQPELQAIELTKNLYPNNLFMEGDVNHLQQCFLNLIFNAIEAMPQGGQLTVTSFLDRNKNSIGVEIRDTGYGMSIENQNHIFDPFFTTKEEGEGTGLGLSIVYGVVKNHKGSIRVKSRVGEGATFSLSFPAQSSHSSGERGCHG